MENGDGEVEIDDVQRLSVDGDLQDLRDEVDAENYDEGNMHIP